MSLVLLQYRFLVRRDSIYSTTRSNVELCKSLLHERWKTNSVIPQTRVATSSATEAFGIVKFTTRWLTTCRSYPVPSLWPISESMPCFDNPRNIDVAHTQQQTVQSQSNFTDSHAWKQRGWRVTPVGLQSRCECQSLVDYRVKPRSAVTYTQSQVRPTVARS